MKRWTDDEEKTLSDLYPHIQTHIVAEKMGRTLPSINGKVKYLGLKKTDEFMNSEKSGRMINAETARRVLAKRKSYNEPWNKGTKGICGQHENCRKNHFKKGVLSGAAKSAYVTPGTYKITNKGTLIKKITDSKDLKCKERWKPVHKILWEEKNGKAPAGYVVAFKNGRKTSDINELTLDCLELISRGELAIRNSPSQRYPEVAKLIQLKGAITRQIKKLSTENNGEDNE